MPKFTTHIQLQEANETDYSTLWSALEKESFKNRKAVIHKDSTAEFSLDRNISIHELTHIVVKAVTKTGKKFSFTIIKDKHSAAHRQQNIAEKN